MATCDKISVVIVSKQACPPVLNYIPSAFEKVVATEKGLAYARNLGAKKTSGELLVFLDGDIALSPFQWKQILNVKPKQFLMCFSKYFPSTRVLSIHRKDFWEVGGFDERLQNVAEDRDFYLRCLDYGLRFKSLPYNSVFHFAHEQVRGRGFMKGFQMGKEHALVMLKHYKRHPEMCAYHFYSRLCNFKIRSMFYELFWFFVLKVRKW
jgi:glycosyltransferase involved in cell wall biosynthesis